MDDNRLDYSNYLHVEEILSHQHLISERHGNAAHIEMLYIIVHQVYELWFKEIIHELDSVRAMFREDYVNEESIGEAVRRLHRIEKVQQLLIQQVDVLETMSPLEFLDFRKYLGTASGFQSFQFRLLENKLGLRPEERLQYANKGYAEEFDEKKTALIKQTEQEPSLFELVGRWLERTPFVSFKEFHFRDQFLKAVSQMLRAEKELVEKDTARSDQERQMMLGRISETEESFKAFLDEKEHDKMVERGLRRLSSQATLAALFIQLYRDEPILRLPSELLDTLVQIDENFTNWRARHAVMVHRMLGRKMGTGHSSGYDYLKRTIEKHRIFSDFFNLATYLIPRSELPPLPPEVKKQLGFYHTAAS
ncbi:MAG: tryptophan 2,3-dioxygenase [Bdellovibrionales bacterium]|nr:tryptophan 2,3-dioxygenase [Bdellovibrionales bacterium]